MTKSKLSAQATGQANKNRSAASADERLSRGGAPHVRGDRGLQDGSERTEQSGLLSTDDLEQLVREEFDQNALPSPPKLAGWHLCWLTTTSGYDTLQKRMRVGYQPVKRSELQGFDPSNGQALATFEEYVTCNEMILCKIPERNYQAIMNVYHHRMPMEEEQAIVQKTKEVTGHASQLGKEELLSKDMGDGTADLEKSVKAAQDMQPTFS